MDQVFCDRCKKEIPRGDDGTLNYFRLELSTATLGKVGRTVPTTEIRYDLCADCKDEFQTSVMAVGLKRSA